MKKFLLFIVISVAVVSLGFTIYRFSTNNEAIIIKNAGGYTINVGESIDLDNVYEVENPSDYTTYTYSTDNNTVLAYNQEAESFTAGAVGGIVNIIIKTSNRNYSELKVSVTVRDGSEEFPFLIANAKQLAAIGTGVFGYDKHYELQGDITVGDLGEFYRWTPIGYNGSSTPVEFTGNFNGNGHTIYNINVVNAEPVVSEPDDDKTEGSTGESADVATAEAATTEDEQEGQPTEDDTVVETPTYDGYDPAYDSSKFVNGAGLFFAIGKDGKVFDLNISTSLIKGDYLKAGIVAGENKGIIHNVTIDGGEVVTNLGNSSIGGLVGLNSGEIYWSGVRGTVGINSSTVNNINGGGLVGFNTGKLNESYFVGKLLRNGTESNFGGIIGKNSYKTNGTTSDTSFVFDTYAVITQTSTIANGDTFGGIIGVNDNYSTDKLNKVGGSYFGVANEAGDYPTNWIAKSMANGSEQALEEETYKKTLDELKSMDTFVRYSYPNGKNEYWSSDVWTITYGVNDGYPVINQDNTIKTIYQNEIEIDYSSAINISSEEDFIKYVSGGKGTFIITRDLDFTNYTGTYTNFVDGYWIPVEGDINITITSKGVDANADGVITEDEPTYATIKGLKIKNLKAQTTDNNSPNNVGLFEEWNEGSISNIKFEDVMISGNSANNIGVLAGVGGKVSVQNVTIKNLTVACSGYNQYVGTLFGKYESSSDGRISAVTIDGATMANGTYATVAGGIVATMNANSSIVAFKDEEGQVVNENKVNNVAFIAKVFGGVVGVNYGSINNVDVSNIKYNVDYTASKGSALYQSAKHVMIENNTFSAFAIGGIAGYSSSSATIQYVNVDNTNTLSIFRTIDDGTKGNSRIYLGGIVGYNASNINYAKSVATLKVAFDSSYRGVTDVEDAPYVGGIIGIGYRSTINYAFFDGVIDTPVDNDGVSVAGGLIGVATPGQSVIFTYSEVTGSITGYYAGAFAGLIGKNANFYLCAANPAGGNKLSGVKLGGFVSIMAKEDAIKRFVFNECYSTYTLNALSSNANAEGAGFVWAYTNNADVSRSSDSDSAKNVLSGITSKLCDVTAVSSIGKNGVGYQYLADHCYFGIKYEGSFDKKYAITSWEGSYVVFFWGIKTDRDYRILGATEKDGKVEITFRYLNQKGLEYTESDSKLSKYKVDKINEINNGNWTVTESGIVIDALAYRRNQI